jgi:transcriptional regulator CtsR
MRGQFTNKKTVELWKNFINQSMRQKPKLVRRWTEASQANYVIETTMNREHIADRFRRAGGGYVEVYRHIPGQLHVRVSKFKEMNDEAKG